MKEKVKLKDIAEKLGVSIVAVSKALNDKDGIGEALKEKVKKTALEMGYETAVMRNKIKRSAGSILIILAKNALSDINMTQGFYLGFFEKLSQKFSEYGYLTQLYVLPKEKENESEQPDVFTKCDNIVGVAFLGECSAKYVENAMKWGVPVILIDFYVRNLPIAAVVTDNINASYDLTKLLIQRGHREIGFVGRINATSSIRDRYLGFYKAMLKYNCSIKKEWLIEDRTEDGIYTSVCLPENLPTAFVCNSDRAAYETVKKIKERGLKVPNDISVVGFDNDVFSKVCEPQLTTVAVNVDDITMTAAKRLVAQIRQVMTDTSCAVIRGKLIERNSVAEVKK